MQSVTNNPRPDANGHSVSAYRRIATVFLLLTAVVVGFVIYIVFLRASVVVLSAQEEVISDSVIDVAREPLQDEVKGDVIEITEKVSQTFPSTSLVTVDVPTEGRVRISSRLFRPQTLVASTRLLTPEGVLFRTRRTVVVPAFGETEVEVFSDEPGVSGGVGSTTFTIPGLNPETRKFFEVETVEPIAGGIRDVRMITAEDVSGAVTVLTDRLKAELMTRLTEEADLEGLGDPGKLFVFDLEQQYTDEPVGSEAEEFTLTLVLRATGVFYDESVLRQRVAAGLRGLIPYDRQLVGMEEDTLEISVEKRDVNGRRAHLRVKAAGLSILSFDAPALNPEKLTGVSVEAAQAYLESVSGVSSASIRLRPFWTKRMPNIADHIEVEVR
ncbi:hypothetical protein AMJ57_02735 [Parcubacteria bacterium SG8_24]|nr:MAG: hypothetical protein AMJ57_02735 [Parcubacteria bacterium SG8_24]